MKSLTILHTEWPNGWGGQEMRIIEESRGIATRGHRVLIVARPECQILPKAREAKLETRELEMRRAFEWGAIPHGLSALEPCAKVAKHLNPSKGT